MSERYLVVGGTSGVGAAVVTGLIEAGAAVIYTGRNAEGRAAHPGVQTLLWDAGDPFPVDAIPQTLAGLVYCPGSIRLKPFARIKEDELVDDLAVNLLGAVRAAQACLPALQRAETAAIVLFSSVAVQTGMPYHASVASAKGAVEGLTRALAAELAPRIRVNAVAPTITDTPLAERLLSSDEKRRMAAERHPLRRIGRPEEIARAVLWLLRDAPLVTGQVIHCDAGLSRLRLA
ncbi:MAG: SDR family oxidoreductase [Chromatiaceae bacterium]|jgi:NAD(P)-dependent dehydrogenase (short-subunit alcohol dehydrogenase family)|nr:SDR family oxidoreductase [Chromatiaceae bacterium]